MDRTNNSNRAGGNSQKGFMDYREGEKYDGIGRTIEELIMKTDKFIVFLDEFGGLQWDSGNIDITSKQYNIVVNRVAELETRSRFLWKNRWPWPWRRRTTIAGYQHALFCARRLLGEAVARLLTSNSFDAAQGILDTAEKWIAQRSLESSRRWMLIPFGILAFAGLFAFFVILFRLRSLPESGSPMLWLLGALLGGVGALISNVSFNRAIPFDATAGLRLHILEAMLRWLVGVVAGLTVLLLVEGNVLFGFIGNEGKPPVATLVLSLLAGLSELFFPTLLNRFDKSLEASGQHPHGGPKTPAPAPAKEPNSSPRPNQSKSSPVDGGNSGQRHTGSQDRSHDLNPMDSPQVNGGPASSEALSVEKVENNSDR